MIKEMFIYRDEIENLSDSDSSEYIVNKLHRAGFDLSSDDNTVTTEHLDGFTKFTQKV